MLSVLTQYLNIFMCLQNLSMKIVVIGAGIVGVSSAYRVKLAFPGSDVTVYADQFTPDTTSDGAAGYVLPLRDSGTNQDLINDWTSKTLEHACALLKSSTSPIGISMVHGFSLFEKENTKPNHWRDVLFDYHVVQKEHLNRFPPEIKSAHCFSTIVIESSKYIPWLMEEFKKLGGRMEQKRVLRLQELHHEFDIIINCSGLGARELVPDENVFPVRGQVCFVKAPWVKEFYAHYHSSGLSMVLPLQDQVLIGGTFEKGNFDLSVDLSTKELILNRAQNIVPSLKSAEWIRDWVGLRPGRDGVRLEIEHLSDKCKVIHNYGHTASGISLHWGCAGVVVDLVKECNNKMQV